MQLEKKCKMLKLEEIPGNYPVYPRHFTAETWNLDLLTSSPFTAEIQNLEFI